MKETSRNTPIEDKALRMHERAIEQIDLMPFRVDDAESLQQVPPRHTLGRDRSAVHGLVEVVELLKDAVVGGTGRP